MDGKYSKVWETAASCALNLGESEPVAEPVSQIPLITHPCSQAPLQWRHTRSFGSGESSAP